jgi:toxin ParE1/3/4
VKGFFLSPEAEDELADGATFYTGRAGASVSAAFLSEFNRAAQLLVMHPGLGTPTSRNRRLFPLRRFPYSLLYRVEDDCVRIVAVTHHRRRPNYWRGRE